ncbi:MAG: metal ABC transporter substrate-binding protein [Thermoproteota archaeon]
MNNQVKLAIIAIVITIPLISFTVFSSDSNQFKKINESKLQVMSSFYPLHEFSQNVGKEKVDVKLLVPVGVEPHDWEPTIKDVQQMQKSDLIVINGIGFESWVDKLHEMNYQGVIVDTSNGIIKNIEEESVHDEYSDESGDPHIWLNPVFAKIQVQNIANAFSDSDPENRQYFQENAARYIKDLDLLDSKIRTELSACNHDFIAFHDSFSYFADEYDLTQHTIISSYAPHTEPTAKTLENVINKAKQLNLKIIFTEETADPKTSQVIANEIGGKILVLSPLEIGNDGTYISRMTENLNHLKEALC